MDSLLRLLLRLILVPLGVLVGMFATMIVVLIGLWQLSDQLAGFTDAQASAMFDWFATGAFGLMMVVGCMWIVAAIGILFSEGFGIRSWIFHAGNGALSAWIGSQFFGPYSESPMPFDGITYVLASGLAGGLAYWLVAGWSAGFWKPVFATTVVLPPSPQPVVTPAQPVVATTVVPPPAPVSVPPVPPVVTTPRPEPKLPRAVPAPPPTLPPAI